MICKKCEKRVWDYLGGRIGGDLREKYSAHLKECSRCRATFARAEKLIILLPSAAAPDPDPEYLNSFWPRLREKMREPGKKSRARSFIRLNPLYYAALGTAAAAVVFWVSFQGPDAPLFRPAGTADYVLSTAAGVSGRGDRSVDYVSRSPSGLLQRGRPDTDYMLPATSLSGNNRFEV